MSAPLKWTFVYTRDSKPLAAFCDAPLAEAYAQKIELGEHVVTRTITIGDPTGAKAIALLRDILKPSVTVEDDNVMFKAIEEGKKLLGL